MKDQADRQTVEIFEVKRGRGRPSTGKAKTSADRQALYRRRKQLAGDNGKSNLNVWIDNSALFALRRLAAFYQKTELEILEKLIVKADEDVMGSVSSKGDNSVFDAYIDKTLRVTEKTL